MYTCSDSLVFTGVGFFNDPRGGVFFAPRDPGARWDDPGYDSPLEDLFVAMVKRKDGDRRGFVFHDACWFLLEQAFHPATVPLGRLFDVCDSLPVVILGGTLNWGHDYGGLSIIRDRDFFPWEERMEDREFPNGWLSAPYSACPLAGSEVDLILAEASQAPAGDPVFVPMACSAVPTATDPFNSLPVELCLAIADCLSVPDILNARLASRSFWHTFYSQQFWASRFRGGSDRSWLFEARDRGTDRDWRQLYHCTNKARLGLALRNRQRIWGLIQHISSILDLQWIQPSSEPPGEEAQDWPLVSGNMPGQQPEGFSQLEGGCRRVQSRRIAVPDGITQVSAATVRVGNWDYVAWISLAASSGQVVEFGYRNASPSRSVHVSGLAGFNLAVGLGGIHALQCIDGRTLEPSAWLGCPDDAPRTWRLDVGARTTALEVGFDVRAHPHISLDHLTLLSSLLAYSPGFGGQAFRIVSIAQKSEKSTSINDLRRSAIWYPDVPPPTVSLNEEFYIPLESYKWGYRPLFWSSFGGPGGIYLPHLTKVTGSGAGLLRMDFSFDIEVPAVSQMFGRREDGEEENLVGFLVDGPGGEVIDKVEVWHHFPREDERSPTWFRKEGILDLVKLSTNRGRSCEFGKRFWRPKSVVEVRREFSATPGTVITGFFGYQVCTSWPRPTSHVCTKGQLS